MDDTPIALDRLEPGTDLTAGLVPIDARLTNPSAVRYIKLGKGGSWSADAIARGIIPFGFNEIAHRPCLASDWVEVARQLEAAGRTPSGVSQGIREIRDFYEQDDGCLWITFADGHLWWSFAAGTVLAITAPDKNGHSRYRQTLDGWHREALTGDALSVRTLSSSLTRVAGYRMTICAVERAAYVLRRIRGDEEPLLVEARSLQAAIEDTAAKMIAALDWRDFEIMVELIFTRGGWQRQSALGVGETDIDLLLDQPTTGETAWVQVKSRADQRVLDDYLQRYERDGGAQRFYFVCHSPSGHLVTTPGPSYHLWFGRGLAARALAAGLLDWLIERTR